MVLRAKINQSDLGRLGGGKPKLRRKTIGDVTFPASFSIIFCSYRLRSLNLYFVSKNIAEWFSPPHSFMLAPSAEQRDFRCVLLSVAFLADLFPSIFVIFERARKRESSFKASLFSLENSFPNFTTPCARFCVGFGDSWQILNDFFDRNWLVFRLKEFHKKNYALTKNCFFVVSRSLGFSPILLNKCTPYRVSSESWWKISGCVPGQNKHDFLIITNL